MPDQAASQPDRYPTIAATIAAGDAAQYDPARTAVAAFDLLHRRWRNCHHTHLNDAAALIPAVTVMTHPTRGSLTYGATRVEVIGTWGNVRAYLNALDQYTRHHNHRDRA